MVGGLCYMRHFRRKIVKNKGYIKVFITYTSCESGPPTLAHLPLPITPSIVLIRGFIVFVLWIVGLIVILTEKKTSDWQ